MVFEDSGAQPPTASGTGRRLQATTPAMPTSGGRQDDPPKRRVPSIYVTLGLDEPTVSPLVTFGLEEPTVSPTPVGRPYAVRNV